VMKLKKSMNFQVFHFLIYFSFILFH